MQKPVRSRRPRLAATAGAVCLGTGLLLALPAPLASAQSATTCFGRPVTIVGTTGPDVRTGTLGSDVFSVLGGNDVVRGEPDGGGPVGAADYICLGDGNDVADGVVGADYFDGGAGNDALTGGMGDDTITAGSGNDTIDPTGAGKAAPSAGADTIDAGEGNDLITERGDGAVDTIDAGPGLDRCVVDKADQVKNCEQVIT